MPICCSLLACDEDLGFRATLGAAALDHEAAVFGSLMSGFAELMLGFTLDTICCRHIAYTIMSIFILWVFGANPF